MAYWLFKSDPDAYGLEDLKKDRKTTWDGVKNNLALKHLRSCAKGDQVFIYHSGADKALVAIAEVTKGGYPDPEKNDPKLAVVDIKYVRSLPRPVTLAEIKARKEFADFALVRMSRLSVMPVSGSQWKVLLKMAGASSS